MDRSSRPADVDAWIRQYDADQQAQINWLVEQVHAAAEDVSEAIKWRRLTFTVDDNWHHWLCAVHVTRAAVSLVLHKGALLDDPGGLLQGDGKYLRQIPFQEAAANMEAVRTLVRDAVAHQTDM